MSTRPDPDEQLAQAAIESQLKHPTMPRARASQLFAPVLQRVQQSKARHAEYLTLRREDGEWVRAGSGTAVRRLRADDFVEIDLVRLDAGALLPELGSAPAQEWLLMDGSLELPCEGPEVRRLPPTSYALVHALTAEPRPRAQSDCVLYRRTLRHPAWLPSGEASWWQKAMTMSGWRAADGPAWGPACKGVAMLPLCVCGEVVSMLVRLEPSAKGANHGHALDEDCVVLRGDMYLGDILLRAGDYQLAPSGGTHFDIASDDGVLFYFHGALDPAVFGSVTVAAEVAA